MAALANKLTSKIKKALKDRKESERKAREAVDRRTEITNAKKDSAAKKVQAKLDETFTIAKESAEREAKKAQAILAEKIKAKTEAAKRAREARKFNMAIVEAKRQDKEKAVATQLETDTDKQMAVFAKLKATLKKVTQNDKTG